MATKLEQSVEALSKTIHEIATDPDIIKAFFDKLDEVLDSAKSSIDWTLKDKYEVGTYRGFDIVHHFRNMPNPYRVSIEDQLIFSADSEEEIVRDIDNFYNLDWIQFVNTIDIKLSILDYGNFLFVKKEVLDRRTWSSSLKVFMRLQSVFDTSYTLRDTEYFMKRLSYDND